jgi:XTP/dITP diphosphohydrolase
VAIRLPPGPIVVASHNPGKARELSDLIAPLGYEVRSAADLGLEEPEETGATFEENAILKARLAATAAGLPALADDSGLVVDALGRDPGIFSARWAGPTRDFSIAIQAVEDKLRAAGADTPEKRRAHFVSALALGLPDGTAETYCGYVYGTMVWPPRGGRGFGYDPIFQPDGHTRTFGEMNGEEKHGWAFGAALSHRARAFQLFARECLGVEL